jgi:hypothetical protein
MATTTKQSPEITRAAEKYLEQYGEPLLMNADLKITILVLAAVSLALAVLVFKSQVALAGMHPVIVRINGVGRAEAIDYRNFQYRPQEAENKYYLSRWGSISSTTASPSNGDQTNSLYFLNADVQRANSEQERKNSFIQTYVRYSMFPFVDTEVKNVALDDLRQSPYSARIEFEKGVHEPDGSHRSQKRKMDCHRNLRVPREREEQ